MADFIKLLTDAGPGVVTLGVVMYFLDKKDKLFTDTIHKVTERIEKIGNVNTDLTKVIEKHVEESKHMKNALQKIYEHQLEQTLAKKNQQL